MRRCTHRSFRVTFQETDMNYRIPYLIFIVLLCLGCNKNSDVTGRITFADGSPLTAGTVTFKEGPYTGTGNIQPDGTYRLGAETVDGGVKPGSYQVVIRGAAEPIGQVDPASTDEVPMKQLIDLKYENYDTSGLTCEVKGKTVFDITVEPSK